MDLGDKLAVKKKLKIEKFVRQLCRRDSMDMLTDKVVKREKREKVILLNM